MNFSILKVYKDEADWDKIRENSLFLGHNSSRMLVPAILYLLVSMKFGPWFMQGRKAWELKNSMRFYNIYSVVLNIYMVNWGLTIVKGFSSFFTCAALSRDPENYAFVTDAFLLTRLVDFLDTMFFILRKKWNQVTTLHVFHHFIVPTGVYFGAHYSMTPFMGLPLFINLFIHMIMYSYYFLATFPSLTPYLWWKRYITAAQIAQFVFDVIYLMVGYILLPKYCGETPNTILIIPLMSVILIFIYQFTSFYIKNFKQRTIIVDPKDDIKDSGSKQKVKTN